MTLIMVSTLQNGAVQLYVAPGAFVWCGVAISGATAGDAKVSSIQVPVIFRVKM